jgi:hypothetical protein
MLFILCDPYFWFWLFPSHGIARRIQYLPRLFDLDIFPSESTDFVLQAFQLYGVSMKLLIAFLFSAILCSGVESSPPTVTLPNGTYSGIYNPSLNQDIFLGIPYAQPPSGSNRLKKPMSLNATWSGVKPATEFGYTCPQ